MDTAAEAGRAGLVAAFDSVNPATGEVIASFPAHDQPEVDAAVARAREAAPWWAGLEWRERERRLLAWKSYLIRYVGRLSQLVHTESGKPLADATLEVILAVEHIDWAARHARTALARQRVRGGMLAPHETAWTGWAPFGVVGVIGPWNYPVFTPVGSLAYALAAGNAVVFKPSEHATAVGTWLVDAFAEVAADPPVLTLVTGGAETGQALAASAVDKIAFTGSATTARRVMAACAERLTPMMAECGGKDALLVGPHANVSAAADAAAWGALTNAGQTCAGVERVYVAASVYDEFVAKLAERMGRARPGSDRAAAYGPMTMPGQLEVVEKHVADALARGATAVVGGLDSVQPPYVSPVLLTGVPEDSLAGREETFGPVVTVTPAADLAEAVRLANGSRYALGASVFERRRKPALAAARDLRAGMTSVNSVLAYATVPALPFGGSGESGFGRVHGAAGLREFAQPKAVTRRRMRPPLNVLTLTRTRKDVRRLLALATLRHGKRYR